MPIPDYRLTGLDRIDNIEQHAAAAGDVVSDGIPQGGPLTQDLDGGGYDITGLGEVVLTGLTGATAPARFVGGTTSGSPVSGTFATGDLVIDQTGKIWVCTAPGSPGTWFPVGGSGSAGGTGVFGDGSDGAVTFDGSSTILTVAPSAGVYTMTRDWYLASALLDAAVSIVPNGYRLFCAGTLTGVDATSLIQMDAGAGAAAGTAGTSFSNSLSSINPLTSTGNALATAGGTGATGNGGNGVNAGGQAFTIGGRGGVGGTGSGGTAGAAGTVNLPTARYQSIRSLPLAVLLYYTNPTSNNYVPIQGGTGGGGGSGDGGSNAGAGGGGGAGPLGLYVKAFAGFGSVHARGGAGGTPSAGNTGGGGGGGGGLVVSVSESVVSGAISGWSFDAAGGAKGSPHGTGTDNAAAGAAGTVILLPN